MIVELHEFIRDFLRKNGTGFVNPAAITRAIHQSSLDKFNKLIEEYRKTGQLPDLLKRFRKRSGSIALVDGSGSLNESDPEIIKISSVVGGSEFEAKIARTDDEWLSRRASDMVTDINNPDNPLHWYIKSIEITDDAGTSIPTDFIKEIGAYSELSDARRYEGKVVSPANFYSKSLLTLIEDPNNPSDPLHLNRASEEIIAFPHDLNQDFIKPIGVEIEITDEKYKGAVVEAENFSTKVLEDLIPDRNKLQELLHLFSDFHVFTLAVVDAGVKDLPADFVDHENTVFIQDVDGNRFEGIILPHNEFLDRVNSSLLPPDAENPVATIYNNKIEFFPKPTVDPYTYVLPYKKFNCDRYPIVKVEDNQVHLRGDLPEGAKIHFHYLKHPTETRAIVKLEGNLAFARPIPTGGKVILQYYAFPVAERALVRYESDGSSLTLTANPVTLTALHVYYLKKPTKPEVSAAYNNGVVTITQVTDLDWDEKAFSDIAARALYYLGFNVKDADITQVKQGKDMMDGNVK